MYSFIRKVISTVTPWGSDQPVNDLEDEEQKIINSIKSMNIDSEEISENTSQQTLCGQSNTVEYDVETFECISKSGKVTHLCGEYGIIDGLIYFEPNQVSAGLTIKLNDEVIYSAYQLKENETFRVLKVYALKNDYWDCNEGDDNKLHSEDTQKVEEICALARVITGRVTERKGREIYVESANVWCHLDKIVATYIPVEGDWVELQAVVSINEESADLAGDVLEIKSLKPLLSKVGVGRVTFWCELKHEGAIENLIYFTNIACEQGYIPNLGDEVVYDAVESDQENFRWRAVKVQYNKLKEENRSMSDDSASIESVSKDTNDPFTDKNDITITPAVCIVQLELNQKKTVTFEVTNHGTTRQILRNIKFHRKQNSQLVLLKPKVSRNLVINPEQTIKFEFQCQGTSLGLTGEICYFHFKGFSIARRFEITGFGNKEMNELLECKFDTVFKVFNSKVFIKNKKEAEQTLYGPRPWKRPRFIKKERKCVFNAPTKLWNILEKNSGVKCIKALNTYAPYLELGLNFERYRDRFHLLLYLEEIDLKINFRKYDMNEVYLTRSDSDFVLEVPGLVERRPSLIVGDRISLTQTWHDGGKVKQIGFIHSIREKEIHVKFHPTFHASYNESECDVTFEPNVNFFSRCHESINRATKLLGKEWLFPSSVNEKPPLIILEVTEEEEQVNENVANFIKQIPENKTEKKEVIPNPLKVEQVELKLKENSNDLKFPVKKKLVWVNKNLNERQKLAVINVLKGTGRPLPYIIFGPPGTGKTVTLVETIIQIYRLIPESRILVTTPSNSSADLICERLIDLGNFKPGQLLRLVAFYRVFEELVPPKLVPYSSYLSTGRSDTKNSEISPKWQVKGIAPEEMPGRHRVTIATCVTIGHLHYLGLPAGHFTHILVDEAGQTTEPEVLISTTFQNARNGQVVLSGDPQQLGPVVCSHTAKTLGLNVSLLQRLISSFPYARDFEGFPKTSGFDPRFITKLNLNYRSVPEILSLPSRLFYNSDLIPTVSQTDSEEAEIIKKFNFESEDRDTPPALIFHGLIGQNYQERDSPSWYNPHEVWQVVFYVRKLYSIGLTCDDIGIVSPYNKQVQKLKILLPSLNLSPPKIGSVEEFQGQERRVIIVTTVRSAAKYVESDITHSLGFVASPQRLNVALTRARALLIIIGNPVLLSRDPYWVSVVNYCLKNKSYTGCSIDIFNEKLKLDSLNEESADNTDEQDPGDET